MAMKIVDKRVKYRFCQNTRGRMQSLVLESLMKSIAIVANVENDNVTYYNLLAIKRMMKKTMAESPMMTAATGAE